MVGDGWLVVGWHSLLNSEYTEKKNDNKQKRKFSWEKLGSNDEEKEKVI